jgi:phosphatidylglycerol:prolipoprotein diacylglycerol transferase
LHLPFYIWHYALGGHAIYPFLGFIGDFPIKTYFILNIAGIIAGFTVLFLNLRGYAAKKKNSILLFSVVTFIPFVIGARLGVFLDSAISKAPYCAADMAGIIGPVSIWWGLLLATICAFPIAKALKVSAWETADLFTMPIAIGGVFARLACFFNGCCYGIEAPKDFPYSVTFPVFPYDPTQEIARYPVQLYYSFSWLVIFIVLALRKDKKLFTGELILDMALLFSVSNFITEFYRYHPVKSLFSISQVLSIFIFITAIFLYVFFMKKRKKPKKRN